MDGNIGTDGIVYMDARKYVCTGIGTVQSSHGSSKNIFIGVKNRTQTGTIFKKGTDDQADGHA